MPAKDFKTITLTDKAYGDLVDTFHARKEHLAAQGIISVSAYATYLMEKSLMTDKPGRFKLITIHTYLKQKDAILYDRFGAEYVIVQKANGALFCQKCREKFCVHVGFCFSIPELYPLEARK